MVQPNEKIEAIQEKQKHFGLSVMCKVRLYVFGYTDLSFMLARLSIRLKESPRVILLASFM